MKLLKTQNLLIQTQIREIHNNLIKSSSEVVFDGEKSELGDVIIGDTSLRKFMPPQVKKWIIATRWCVVQKFAYMHTWCSLN